MSVMVKYKPMSVWIRRFNFGMLVGNSILLAIVVMTGGSASLFLTLCIFINFITAFFIPSPESLDAYKEERKALTAKR